MYLFVEKYNNKAAVSRGKNTFDSIQRDGYEIDTIRHLTILAKSSSTLWIFISIVLVKRTPSDKPARESSRIKRYV